MSKATDKIALDEWYVIGFAADIQPGAARRTRLLGQDVVIARDAAGAIAVTEADGGAVPGMRLLYGFVWATLGEPKRGIVEIPEFADTTRRFLHRGRIFVPISGLRVIENFFDLSHFSFVHTGTLGGYESAEVPKYGVELRDEGRELWAVGCSFFQPQASAAAGGGATVYYDYRVPAPYIAIIYKDSMVKRGAKDLIGLFIQPEEEERCTVHSFALLYDETNSDTHILHFYHEIFAQDRAILIHQTPKTLPVDLRREVPATSDASSVAYRRWIDRSGLNFGVERAAT